MYIYNRNNNNLILNGKFDDSDDFWNFTKSANVEAERIIDDHYYVNITDGGTTPSDIIISQNNIALDQNKKYILNFDARAQDDKFIDVKIRKASAPFTDYTKIGAVYLNSAEESFIEQFDLRQNYPNPFNPITNIEFRIPTSGFVTLKIYNLLGEEVETLMAQKLNPGKNSFRFDGQKLASGVYFYQLVAGQSRAVKKMILLK